MPTTLTGSILLSGGTIIAFDEETDSLEVIRNGAVLITGDRIAGIYATAHPSGTPANTEVVDCTHKIISPGFVDTHRHGWQTALKTLAPNTTLPDYMSRFVLGAASAIYTAEDVYIGQLAGLLEALNAGVTTTLDHAHHTWSNDRTKAGLEASIDSGARVYWNHAFSSSQDYPVSEQIANFKELVRTKSTPDGPTTIGVAFDGWTFSPPEDVQAVIALTK